MANLELARRAALDIAQNQGQIQNRNLSHASKFTIEEITGAKRAIHLRGRALPYRGLKFHGIMRHKKTYYAGNPVGTVAILGPQEEPTTIEGMWKDRFLYKQALVFQNERLDSVNTAQELVNIFDDFRISGNRLRVQWASIVRFGYLTSFEYTFDNEHDIKWEAEFDWIAKDTDATSLASSRTPPIPSLRSKINSIDNSLARTPREVVRAFKDRVFSQIKSIRKLTGIIFDQVRLVQDIASTPGQILGAIGSAAESIKFEGEEAISRLSNTPRSTIQATDRVTDILRVEIWRRNAAFATIGLQATALKREREIRQRARPGSIAVMTVPSVITLRALSLQLYNTADSWQDIANANRIKTSIVPAGTVIIIPPPKPALGVNTRGAFTG